MPETPPSRTISQISPTSVDRLLRCPRAFSHAQGASPQQRGQAAPAPSAVVGIAAHRTLELCLQASRPSLHLAWGQACEEGAAVGIDPRSRPDARRTLLRLERRLPQLLEFVDARNPSEVPRTESELVSSDGLIRGTVDLIVLGDLPCIVDYKTGLVSEDGVPVEHFVRQLSLYAHLVHECLGVDISEAALFSLREGIIPVDVSLGSRRLVVEECRAAQAAYNALVPGPQPAVPSVAACSHCALVGVCEGFWGPEGRKVVLNLTSGRSIEGRVDAPPVLSASGVGAIAVKPDDGQSDAPVTVIDVPNELIEQLAHGSNVRCWRLRADPEAPSSLRWKAGQSGLVVLA